MMLKMHLETIFLKTFKLFSFESVQPLITDGMASTKRLCYTYRHSPMCMLRNLLLAIEDRADDLIRFSSNNFLGDFKERASLIFSDELPDETKESGTLTFFERFLDNDCSPRTQSEHNEMIEWCLFAVQFEQGNVERMNEALKILYDVLIFIEKDLLFDYGDNEEEDVCE